MGIHTSGSINMVVVEGGGGEEKENYPKGRGGGGIVHYPIQELSSISR